MAFLIDINNFYVKIKDIWQKKKTQEEAINDFIKKHGNKYDYSLVEYVNNKTKIKIICNTCKDIYLQTPSDHLAGKNIRCSCNTLTEKRFLKEAKEKHNNIMNQEVYLVEKKE